MSCIAPEISQLEARNADLDAYSRLVIGLKQLYPYRFLHLVKLVKLGAAEPRF